MKNEKNKEKNMLLFGATSFGIMTIVALIVTILFARILGAYVSGGVTVLILGIVTYVLFSRLGADKAEAESKIEDSESTKSEKNTDEVKTDPAQAPAAAEAESNPSGFDEVALSAAQGYFGEEYVKNIESQKARVFNEINAGFNKGLKDAIDGYESSCAKKMEVFSVNFKPKASKGGGDADAK